MRVALASLVAVAALVVVVAVVVAGCGGGDDAGSTEPAVTTPAALKTNVYERSLSECSTAKVTDLARTYNVSPRQKAVATAVAARWVDTLHAFEDAVQSGRDGCMLGFRMQASENVGSS
jgi:hypothetical protein